MLIMLLTSFSPPLSKRLNSSGILLNTGVKFGSLRRNNLEFRNKFKSSSIRSSSECSVKTNRKTLSRV